MKITKRVSLEPHVDLAWWALPFCFNVFRFRPLSTIYTISFLCFDLDLEIAQKWEISTKHGECPEGRLHRICPECIDRSDCPDSDGHSRGD